MEPKSKSVNPPESRAAHLEVLVAHLGDFAFLFDIEARFLFANRPLLELLDQTEDGIIGKTFHDLPYPPALADRLTDQIRAVAASGKPTRDETPLQGASDRIEHYEYQLSPVFADDGKTVTMVAGSSRNVTARVEAERRLDTTLIAGEIGTWIFDIEKNEVFADRNMAALFGVSEEDADGGPLRAYLAAIHPEDRSNVRRTIGRALRAGEEFETQYRLVTPSGERTMLARGRVEHDAEGRAIRLPGVILDLTGQRRAEAELIKTQDRLGIAVEAAELGTFSLSIPFEDVMWNEKCREHFWISPDSEVTFEQTIELLHPDDQCRVRDALMASLENGTTFDSEHRTVSPQGEVRWIHAIGRCIHDQGGRPVRLDGITMDVTERLRLEASRGAALDAEREARLEAERSGRFKDAFLAALSHELRTPLTPVLMCATILQRDKRLPDDVRESLGMIERNVSLEARLIDDLLDLTSVAEGKLHLRKTECEAHGLIELALGIVRDDAVAKGVTLTSCLSAGRSVISADASRFQQVIWNLLRNAVKFTPDGGNIMVETTEEEDGLCIKVIDSGQGMSAKALSQAFTPFSQGELPDDHRFGGLGLGLTIARSIVDAHGGRVGATSDGVDQGSEFKILWPFAEVDEEARLRLDTREGGAAESERAQKSGVPVELPRSDDLIAGQLRVLLVEDHDDSRVILSRLLKSDGHAVTAAGSVTEAMGEAREKTFDLVVSDLGLPDGTGHELMVVLHDEYGLKGIALSGYGMDDDRVKARQSGFVDHLTKPIDFETLRKALASFIDDHRRVA